MPVSSSTSRVRPSTTDSPSCTSITPPGVDQSREPLRRRFCTRRTPSGPSTMPPATSHSRTFPSLQAAPPLGSSAVHPNVERVVKAAVAQGLVIEPREFAGGTRTAADAAAAIGVPVGAIVKSLVWSVDGRPVLALVSGDNRLDETKLAVVAGGVTVSRPDAAVVR